MSQGCQVVVHTCAVQDLGQYLVAGRDLAPASLVLHEEMAVLGPAEEGGVLCLGCYFPWHGYRSVAALLLAPILARCQSCGAPLCGPSCEGEGGHHGQECATLAVHGAGGRLAEDPGLCWVVTPLRLLLLRTADPTRYITSASLFWFASGGRNASHCLPTWRPGDSSRRTSRRLRLEPGQCVLPPTAPSILQTVGGPVPWAGGGATSSPASLCPRHKHIPGKLQV